MLLHGLTNQLRDLKISDLTVYEKPPTIDHTITAVPKELRGGYTGFWRAADVLEFMQLYSQIRPNKVALDEYPVATNEAKFSATIFYTLQRLKVGELSDTLLFETSEKARYTELSSLDKMREWIISQGISKAEFNKVVHSAEVKEDVNNAINLTEEYGVFTFPYVVVGGKYVLTASTLYNDDYGVAVLDFLVNKLEQERKK